MRTTLDLDDGVLAAAKSIARDEGESLGRVISRLARAGLSTQQPIDDSGVFPVFSVPPDAPILTLDVVNRYRDDD